MIIGHHCAQTGYWKLSFTLLRPDTGIRSQPEFLESNVMMLHVPDVLTGEQTQTFYKTLVESDKWVDGRSTVGPQGAQVKRNLQLDDRSDLRHRLAAELLRVLRNNPLFFAASLPLNILPPLFNRYRDGGTYGMHVDGAVMQGPGDHQLRSDLACTLFFSNPDDYDGGELEIGRASCREGVEAGWGCVAGRERGCREE